MDLVLETIRKVAQVIYEPMYIVILSILAINLYVKNKKVSTLQKFMLGKSVDTPQILTASQLLFGGIAGVLASVILSLLGVMFTQNSGIEYLLLISIIMMFVNPRFICFSYSGTVIGFLSVIINDVLVKINGSVSNIEFLNIDITSLIALVGVMHLVEGILILVDGKRGMLPIFSNEGDKIKGGFMFNRYWALPSAIMLVVTSVNEVFEGATVNLAQPSWWPLITSQAMLKLLSTGMIAFLGIYFIVSYQAVTFTSTPNRKVVKSGSSAIIYGLIMIVISPLAQYNAMTKIILLILMPLLHEIISGLQQKKEKIGTPIYVSDEKGLCVLYVIKDSIAYENGIESRDKILEVNDNIIEDDEQINQNLKYLKLKILKQNGEEKIIEIRNLKQVSELGILLVPSKMPKEQQILKY